MKYPEQDIDFIIRFFDFALSDSELSEFENKITNDSEFYEKVKAYKKANAIVEKANQDYTKQSQTQKWKKLLTKQEATKSPKNITWKWIASIAAGLVLLFSIWQFNATLQEPDMNQLIANSWNKNVGLGYYTNRSDVKNLQQEKIVKAFLAYKRKDYNKTIKILEDFKEYNHDVVLLKALSTHKIGDSKTALGLLDTLIDDAASNKSKTAIWYKGLIYLDLGDEASAQKLLKLPNDKTSKIELKEQ